MFKRLLFSSLIAIPLGAQALPALGKEIQLIERAPTPNPTQQTIMADMVVTGKVIEIEKDTLEVPRYPGASKNEVIAMKFGVIKIDQAILGGKGITQVRLGFSEGGGTYSAIDEPFEGRGLRQRYRGGAIELTANLEGAFFLILHHSGEFYTMNQSPAYWDPKSADYTSNLKDTKKIAQIIENPITALNAKDPADRAQATKTLLTRYRSVRHQKTTEVNIPAEETKLLIDRLIELPYLPPGNDANQPHRRHLFDLLSPGALGFKNPDHPLKTATNPLPDYNVVMDEAQVKFLKERRDKLKLKMFVSQ